MFPIRLLSTALLCVCLASVTVPAHALDAGEMAPNVELMGANGEVVRLPLQAGKVLYVDFWASWCGPCRQSFPWMNAMQEKYKSKGLQIIGINLDQQANAAEKFLAQNPAKFTILFDPKGISPRTYGVKGMPTSVLIGRDGKVIQHHAGFNETSREQLEQLLQTVLAGQK